MQNLQEYRGQRDSCDTDDSTLMLLDFGDTLFAFGALAGPMGRGFQHSFFGTEGSLIGAVLLAA
jgi:hypothetical protein